MNKQLMAFAAMVALLGGCAAMEKSDRRIEARQLAWTGPGIGPCAFGGVTPLADAHCSMLNWGPEGVLTAINQKAIRRVGQGAGALAHVEEVSRILLRHEDMSAERLYTCRRDATSEADCHVSLLVTAVDGERFVVDSGRVVGQTMASHGVATFMVFELFVNGVYAVGTPPVAHMAGGGASTSAAAAR